MSAADDVTTAGDTPATEATPPGPTIGDVAELVRSKNAGPFWQTLDIFLTDDDTYARVASSPHLDEQVIADLYRTPADSVTIYRLPAIRVVKISFPRPVTQGGVSDRDMHAGQQHIPLAQIRL